MRTGHNLPQRVLAVGAHPDDIEILCAGTMALYAQAGCTVTLCAATTGDRGGAGDRDAIARARDAESKAAADIIGAEYVCAGVPDGEVDAGSGHMRDLFVDIIRDVKPDIVFAHDPDDYHADHRATSKLLFDATFMAAIPHVGTARPATEKILPLFYMDTLAGIGFVPEQYVDITAVFATKQEMLACHGSQLDWMREHDRLDFLDFTETMSKFRGIQCGVRYAEAFRPAHAWHRETTSRLLP